MTPNTNPDAATPTTQHCQVANRGGATRQNVQKYVIEAIHRPAAMPAASTATHNIAVLALLTLLNIRRGVWRVRALACSPSDGLQATDFREPRAEMCVFMVGT